MTQRVISSLSEHLQSENVIGEGFKSVWKLVFILNAGFQIILKALFPLLIAIFNPAFALQYFPVPASDPYPIERTANSEPAPAQQALALREAFLFFGQIGRAHV